MKKVITYTISILLFSIQWVKSFVFKSKKESNQISRKLMTCPPPRIYLAGDIVFRPDANTIFERLRTLCHAAGCEGVAPFDGQEDLRNLPPGEETTLAIVRADRTLMDSCDGGVFCLDPFRRAPDMDPGTAVEIGYMAAQGKPLVGYTIDGRSYPNKVASYFRDVWKEELRERTEVPCEGASSSIIEDPDGFLAHSEGFVQNGMTEGFIRLSGGIVYADPNFYHAFEKAVVDLAARLNKKSD